MSLRGTGGTGDHLKPKAPRAGPLAIWHKATARPDIQIRLFIPLSSRGPRLCSRRSKSFNRALHGRVQVKQNISAATRNIVFLSLGQPNFQAQTPFMRVSIAVCVAPWGRANRRTSASDGVLRMFRLTQHSPREDRGMHSRAFVSEVSGRDYALRPRKPPHGGKPSA